MAKKNIPFYIVIALLVLLFFYNLSLEESISNLKTEIAVKEENISELNNKIEELNNNNLEENISKIMDDVGNINGYIDDIYSKLYPDSVQSYSISNDE